MRRIAVIPVLVSVLGILCTIDAYAQRRPRPPAGGGGGITPMCVSGCQGPSPVLVTPDGQPDTIVVTSNPGTNLSRQFTVTNIGSYNDTYTLTMGCSGAETCVSQSQYSANLNPGSWTYVTVTFTPGQPGTSGAVMLTAESSGDELPEKATGTKAIARSHSSSATYISTGSYIVASIAGPAPVVSMLAYSAGFQSNSDGVLYSHAVPAIGSMGNQWGLALAYNSFAAKPVAAVTVQVTNPYSGPYPNAFKVQLQRVDNGAYLTLLNDSTSVYYGASSGSQAVSRMIAAVNLQANGLATGAHPINVVVTAIYTLGTRTSSVSSRVLVNDRSAGPFGAGVGLTGIGQLYPNPTSGYGMLLVDGAGTLSYFHRASSTDSAFTSAAGESRKLRLVNDAMYGALYRLAALDSSLVDFLPTGYPIRTFTRPGLRNLAFGYTSNLLTSVADTTGREFTLSYSNWKLSQITDHVGRITTVSVNSSTGRLVKVTDADGLSDSLIYASGSLLSEVRDRANGTTSLAYNALMQQDSVQAPAAADHTGSSVRPTVKFNRAEIVVWQPGTSGISTGTAKANVRPDTVVLTIRNPLGAITRAALDRFGLTTKVIDAVGQITTVARDTLGNITSIQQPSGATASSTYSGYLLTSTTDNFTGRSLAFTYNARNQVVTATGGPVRIDYVYNTGSEGPAGTLRVEYAGSTQTPGTAPAGGDTLAHHYPDHFGRDTAVTDALGHRSRFIFATPANGGNLTQTIDGAGHSTSYSYNSSGMPTSMTTPTGATWSAAYDVLGRDSVSTDPRGGLTRFTFAPQGNTRVMDPRNQVYKFDINSWGLVTGVHDLGDSTRVDSLGYDMGGLVRSFRNRRGDNVSMTYDSLGRVSTRSGPDFPTQYFRYGLNGAWVVDSNAYAKDSLSFDQAGRLTAAAQRVNGALYTQTYQYDSQGRLTSRTNSGGGSNLRYVHAQGRLDTLCAIGTCVAFSRDVERKPTATTFNTGAGMSNPWSHLQVFDSLHQVRRDSFSVTALNADFGATWVYDSLGRVDSMHTPATGNFYPRDLGYDLAGQLTQACAHLGGSQYCWSEYGSILTPYAYDATGNRIDYEVQSTIGTGNRYSQFKNYSLVYDVNGSLVQKNGLGNSYIWNSIDTTRFEWNALGQLTRVEKWVGAGAHTVDSLFYDAQGRRVAKKQNGTITWFAHIGEQVLLDIDGSNTVLAEYAYMPNGALLGMKTSSFTGVAITTPTNGTVVGLAHAQAGGTIKRYDGLVSPWGQQPADTGTVVRFRLAGQEYDQETGLYHLGARYYDPQLGRFLSEDPAGISAGLNLYAYAGNDPLNRRDPNGMDYCYYPVEAYHRTQWVNQETGKVVWNDPWEPIYGGLTCVGEGAGVDNPGGSTGGSNAPGSAANPIETPDTPGDSLACAAAKLNLGINAAMDVLTITSFGFSLYARVGARATLMSARAAGRAAWQRIILHRVYRRTRDGTMRIFARELAEGALPGALVNAAQPVLTAAGNGEDHLTWHIRDFIPIVASFDAYDAMQLACK